MSKIIEVYESASTDGYSMYGDGVYFLELHQAEHYSTNKHRGYGRTRAHDALQLEDGRVFTLKSTTPIIIQGSKGYAERIKEGALAKLSPEEKEILGL